MNRYILLRWLLDLEFLIGADGFSGPDWSHLLLKEGAILFISFDDDFGSWSLDMQ